MRVGGSRPRTNPVGGEPCPANFFRRDVQPRKETCRSVAVGKPSRVVHPRNCFIRLVREHQTRPARGRPSVDAFSPCFRVVSVGVNDEGNTFSCGVGEVRLTVKVRDHARDIDPAQTCANGPVCSHKNGPLLRTHCSRSFRSQQRRRQQSRSQPMKDRFSQRPRKRLFSLAWQPPQTLGSRVVVTCRLQTQSTLQITLIAPSKMRPHVVLNVHQRRVGGCRHAPLESVSGQEDRAIRDFIIRGLVLPTCPFRRRRPALRTK